MPATGKLRAQKQADSPKQRTTPKEPTEEKRL
jgi:hypothetical protein